MREPTIVRDRERGATGVVDTLSLGYATVNRHPWLLVIPILLDVLFWLGPRLSVATLAQNVIGQAPIPAGLSDEMLQNYATVQQSATQAAEGFNLLSLLSTNFPGIPSLMADKIGAGPVAELTTWATVAGVGLVLALAGVWLASLYYTAIATQVTGVGVRSAGFWISVWRNWLRLVGLVLLGLVVITLVGLPLLVAVLLVMSLAASAGSLVVSFLWVAAIWIEFYLFFTVEAVVISDVGPLRAIQNSFKVVRYNLGSSLGLIVLIWVITLGMPIVWNAMVDNVFTAAIAILGNSYVSTGLTAASIVFYRERYAALRTRS